MGRRAVRIEGADGRTARGCAGAARRPKASAAAKAARERVFHGVLVEDVTAMTTAEGIAALSAITGLEFVSAEAAEAAAAKRAHVLVPAGLSLENALTLLLAPAGLAYAITDEGTTRVVPAKEKEAR